MTLERVDAAARAQALAVRGVLHPGPHDGAPEGTGTIVLLGPDEPRFWQVFTASPEYGDGGEDPLDRWSKRVIGALASDLGAPAIFPSDGPPYPPFLQWAVDSGRCWPSPVGLLVHDQAGLFLSFRGALALPDRLDLPAPPTRPCDTCAAPCTTACPVSALAERQAYDVSRCQAHVASPEGAACRQGCLVRRACPVAKDFRRRLEQSTFHMSAFMRHYRP
ncbi:ferredoxin [Nioella sp.]|uniref:ferredoxin n=1 Tax=Nioella sp. TaxID=1912091 RepID=UPI003516CD2A